MNLREVELRDIENAIKFIFNKKEITELDIRNANILINMWKKLTHWVERTENPIKE